MQQCKNCLNKDCLEFIKDYQYQFDDNSSIEIIDVFKCSICGCIHWETKDSYCYEYLAGSNIIDTTKAIGNWVTDNNKKELV